MIEAEVVAKEAIEDITQSFSSFKWYNGLHNEQFVGEISHSKHELLQKI